jgi:hypothetical protein
MDSEGLVGVVMWLSGVGFMAFILYRLKMRRRHIGSAGAGTVYDIVQEDKRKAIEIVVAGKAESRDFERGEDDRDP